MYPSGSQKVMFNKDEKHTQKQNPPWFFGLNTLLIVLKKSYFSKLRLLLTLNLKKGRAI